MSRVYFFRPYDGRSFRSAHPPTDPQNLQATLAAGGARIPAAVISQRQNGGQRNWVRQNTPFQAHIGPVAAGVEPNKPSEATSVAPQQRTAPAASDRTSSSLGDDGTFDCSSSAPYWIPEEVKHYFVHRHSLAGTHTKDDSSQRTDRALRDIGRERELPTDNLNEWSRWREAVPRSAVITAIAIATIIAIVIFLALAGDLRGTDLSSGGGEHEAVVLGKHDTSGGSHNDFLMPVPGDDHASDHQHPEKTTDARETNKEHGGNEDGPDEILGDSVADLDGNSEADGEGTMSVKQNAEPAVRSPVEEIEIVALPSLNTQVSLTCGTPTFTLCSLGRKEFYYTVARNACVALANGALGVCARGPNRFPSMERCRQQCVATENAAPECNQNAIFAECQRRDVFKTWWYHDGRRCRRWNFLRGHCPSRDTDVFATSAECSRRCSRGPKRNTHCRVPPAAPCAAEDLRFAYFADVTRASLKAKQCREITAPGKHLCLTGSNRYSSLDDCRKTCMRAVS